MAASRHAARAVRALAAQPREGAERVRERAAAWVERRRPAPAAPWGAPVAPDGGRELHALLGLAWPCPEAEAFAGLWDALGAELRDRGLRVGRGSYAGWDDADAGLARAAWCLARHLRPRAVLETGVARGLTTRVLLEALARDGDGRLWSVDLPPLAADAPAGELAAAVPARLRARWTLRTGSTRRVLPGLVAELGRVDLFVHDSLHTTRNVRFELERVWPALRPGGAALVDDVDRNRGLHAFAAAHPGVPVLVSLADDGRAQFGCLLAR